MATQMHEDNFGVQKTVGVVLSGYYEPGTYMIPVGYNVDDSGANVTDNGDGTFTLATAGQTISFTPKLGTGCEVTDSAGDTIEANTVDQSAL